MICSATLVMVKEKASGFAMPCDLRKKAALTNFLRDIRWCLMFVFVSVVPFFPLFFLILSWQKSELCKIVFPLHKKTKLTKHKEWSAPLLHFFCFVAFDKKKAYYLLCNLFNLQHRSILRCALNFFFSHHSQNSGCFDFLSFLVAGTWICSVTLLASQLQF